MHAGRVVAGLVGLVVALCAPAVASAQEATTSISGTVYGGEGTSTPVARACVTAYHAEDRAETANWVSRASAKADGTYTVDRLPPGRYRLIYSVCNTAGEHRWAPTFHDRAAKAGDATTVLTTLEAPATGVEGHLLPGATISGTVRNRDGEPVGGVCVSSSPRLDMPYQDIRTKTNADGTYRLAGLGGGRHRLLFTPCDAKGYTWTWLNSTDGASNGDEVQVATGAERGGIDLEMPYTGRISGRVFGGPTDALPVGGACVSASWPNGKAPLFNTTRTAADGTYTLDMLPEGEYRLKFSPCDAVGRYTSAWYDRATSAETAKVVRATHEEPVTGIDGHLPSDATISGAVTDEDGRPMEGVCVEAYPNGGTGDQGSTKTGALGTYVITGLSGGDYRVRFGACGAPDHVTEYWEDEPDAYRARTVEVPSGGAVAGITAQLERATTISGTVRLADGTPARDICVWANPVGGDSTGLATPSASTGRDGTYTLTRVPVREAGYRLRFTDCWSRYGLVTQWYGGDDRHNSGTPVVPTLAAPATGIDVTMTTGGVIVGRISEPDGRPVTSGVCVAAQRTSTGDTYFQGETAVTDDGTYRIAKLGSGTYTVRFAPCQSGDRNDTEQLRPGVAVTAGATTAGIDATMQPAPFIAGHVYAGADGDTSTPLADVCVTGWVPNGRGFVGRYTARTDAAGAYTLRRIAPGAEVRVTFAPCAAGSEYREEAYDDVATIWDPGVAVLRPTAAAPSTGIDAHLASRRPETTIATAETAGLTARFTFRADAEDAEFECRLDDGPFAPCASPYATGPLLPGEHTFAVRAQAGGWTESTPATVTWTAGLTPPVQEPEPPVDEPELPVAPETPAAPQQQAPQAEPPAAPITPPAPPAAPQADARSTPAPTVVRSSAPALRLVVPARPATARGLRLTATCAPGCEVTARATVSRATAKRLGLPARTLGTTRAVLSGKRTTVAIALSSRARRALRRSSGPVRVTVTLSGPGVRTQRTLTLR